MKNLSKKKSKSDNVIDMGDLDDDEDDDVGRVSQSVTSLDNLSEDADSDLENGSAGNSRNVSLMCVCFNSSIVNTRVVAIYM